MAKIVVADDEESVVDLLRAVFEKNGHKVIAAYHGADVFPLCLKESPDLLILDIMLPGVDGYTVAMNMAQNELTQKIPIMVLTAAATTGDLFRIFRQVVHFIPKPFDTEDVLAKAEQILASKPLG